MRVHAPGVRPVAALVSAALVGTALAVAAPAAADDPALPTLLVSEINPDNGAHVVYGHPSTQDNFEFVEIANPGAQDVDLVASGVSVAYTNGTNVTSLSLAADSPSPAVVPAGGALTLWLRYSSGTADGYSSGSPNAFLFDADDFRAHYGLDAGVPVAYVTGQAGFANSGTRGVALRSGGQTIASSTYTAGTDTAAERSAHYRRPASGTAAGVHAQAAVPSPGSVTPDQLVAPSPDPSGTPTSEPTTTPTPEPTTEPTTQPTTEPTTGPTTPPGAVAPILQVTELAPDTPNLAGADAYEFIEVYNGSAAPVSFDDFTISYLYVDANAVQTSAALWPATPTDPVIPAGGTLVLWIKNDASRALTAADFNAQYGTDLAAGTQLVEIASGGMANAGPRGIRVATNTGEEVSTAYWFTDAQTTPTTAIQYAWNPGPGDHLWTPADPAGPAQTLVGLAAPTPGRVSASQVPTTLVAPPVDATAPVVRDLTGGSESPDADSLDLLFDVTDDRQVRTVALTLTTNVDAPVTHLLTASAPHRFGYSIPAVDLLGKRWVEYTVRASDGTHTTTSETVRLELGDGQPDAVRLDVRDGQFVGGATRVAATTEGDPADLGLAIDGEPVGSVVPSLEKAPVFAFEATSTDAFFRNGVKLGDQVLTIFDEGFYSRVETVTAEVPVDQVLRGRELTIGIYAGTKAWPQPDVNENNDDFSASNVRLALPDGRVLRPTSCGVAGEAAGAEHAAVPCPDPSASIGFKDATLVYFTATFTIPDDAFGSLAHVWDTTAVADGEHTVTATAGTTSVTRTVVVDNTAPQVTTPLVDGTLYRGPVTVDAQATDAGSGVASLTATLDGAPVTLPHVTSSLDLTPGEHVAVLEARDTLGSTTRRTLTFRTADETPVTDLLSPLDGAQVPAGDVVLRATPTSPEGDALGVALREGYAFTAGDDEVTAASGVTGVAAGDDLDPTLLSADELAKLASTDGLASQVSSATQFPYQLFTVAVPADAGADAHVRVAWSGSANADAKVLLYVRNTTANRWDEVDRHLTTDGGATDFTLGALVPVADHLADGTVTVLVQHSEGFAGEVRSTRESAVTPFHAAATPRDEYDFTVAWESDTQYYNENPAFYPHQLAIHRFLLEQRDALNLQYLVHTGDIVDDYDQPEQWERADAAYAQFDQAGLPYGVLAGNHDVGHAAQDYSQYSARFGAARFEGNPWYGGQLQDNRGHYDLITADGIDLLVLYMGWGPADEQIAWMNEVARAYPERKVWIALHEFMLTTGGLGPIPQRVMDEVVATNPNVFAVSSGHYHDAYTRTDEFDDDGDGTADRTVYSMLFDYQGLTEGGQGYLRLLHFDNDEGRIVVRTYSPSLDDFDSDDASLNSPPGMQEFTVPYAAVGLTPTTKTLATDSFRVDVLTSRTIASFASVPSGATVSAVWRDVPAGEHGWYVLTTGPHGGVHRSAVRTFVAAAPTTIPLSPVPTISGTAAVGEALRAVPGTWTSGTTLRYQWLADGTRIAGATSSSLVLAPAHRGKRISVQVTGTLAGHPQVVRTSAATPSVAAGALRTATPAVVGAATVGRTLTARPGSWGPAPVTLAYRWYADGSAIRGATSSSYRLAPAQAGKRITVRVTGTRTGYATTSVVSRATAKVAKALLTSARPTITGTPKVGRTLTVSRGTWTPGTRFTYAWFADGRRISGATSWRFTPGAALAGTRVTVQVTGTLAGYETHTRTSAAVTIRR